MFVNVVGIVGGTYATFQSFAQNIGIVFLLKNPRGNGENGEEWENGEREKGNKGERGKGKKGKREKGQKEK